MFWYFYILLQRRFSHSLGGGQEEWSSSMVVAALPPHLNRDGIQPLPWAHVPPLTHCYHDLFWRHCWRKNTAVISFFQPTWVLCVQQMQLQCNIIQCPVCSLYIRVNTLSFMVFPYQTRLIFSNFFCFFCFYKQIHPQWTLPLRHFCDLFSQKHLIFFFFFF